MTNVRRDTRTLINQAWMRDGDIIVTGQALLLATLLHTHGKGRDSEDFKDVQRIMHDPNLKED